MAGHEPDIVVVSTMLEQKELARLTAAFFEDMVKYVADVRRGVIAVGGELHADGKALVLAHGSQQEDLCSPGFNAAMLNVTQHSTATRCEPRCMRSRCEG
jgi:hypothetical protein